MKAITPVIAITILILMAIAAAAMAYLMITNFQDQAAGAGQTGLESLTTRSKTQLKIESVSGGKIYLRNYGTVPLYGANFFLDGRPLEVSGTDECPAGQLCTYTITGDLDCPDECDLSMGADMPLGTWITVTGGQIEGEQATYNITLEATETWGPVNQGWCSAAIGFDGSRKLLTLLDNPSQIRIWNITDGALELENTTITGETASYGGAVIDLDGDGAKEFIALNPGNAESNLSIYNYTSPNFYLENQTESTGVGGRALYAGNLDGDASVELVVAGKTAVPLLGIQIWNYTGTQLLLEGDLVLQPDQASSYNPAVQSADVDGDTDTELLIVYTECQALCMEEPCCLGGLNITQWDGDSLLEEHQMAILASHLKTVYAADFDNDGVKEILVAGEIWNETTYDAFFRIYSWDGSTLELETETQWQTDTEADSVRAKDLTADGILEIVIGGLYGGDRGTVGSISVWNWDGSVLARKAFRQEDWLDYTGVYVDIYDLDGDGEDEILVLADDVFNNGYVHVMSYELA